MLKLYSLSYSRVAQEDNVILAINIEVLMVKWYCYYLFLPVGGIRANISFHGRVRKCMMQSPQEGIFSSPGQVGQLIMYYTPKIHNKLAQLLGRSTFKLTILIYIWILSASQVQADGQYLQLHQDVIPFRKVTNILCVD